MKTSQVLALCLLLGMVSCTALNPASTPPIPVTGSTILPASAKPPVTYSPILFREYTDRNYSFQILGGVNNGVWITDDEAHSTMQYGILYDVYHDNGFAGATTISNIESIEPPFCGSYYVGSDMSETAPNMFGFARGWKVTIRPYTEILVDNAEYKKVVADWLTAQGIANPEIHISRIVKVDIEGDGVDEVFVAATHIKNPSTPLTEAGDYSIILMQKVSGKESKLIPLAAEVYHSLMPDPTYPNTYFLSEFIDLNQDGNLEVILKVTRWEGSGIIVYEVKGIQTLQVLKEICSM